jgi:membrane protein YqaA with SNARE-associated domain
MVLLVAKHHDQLPVYVLGAATGSTIGVLLLDLVCRKGGEEGLKRLVKPKLLGYLKQQMKRHAAAALIVSCLAPPPFPFGASIAAASAFQYPRLRLLVLVLLARTIRFSLVGWAAIYFGRHILRIADSTAFMWFMGGFIVFCLVGSIVSIIHWVRIGRSRAS